MSATPPLVPPAAAHSHPDRRGIPILIVALQNYQDRKPCRQPGHLTVQSGHCSRMLASGL